MTIKQLTAWRSRLGLSQVKAAALMGISTRQYLRYESGETRISKLVELACEAIETRPKK